MFERERNCGLRIAHHKLNKEMAKKLNSKNFEEV